MSNEPTAVSFYELDSKVFEELNNIKDDIKDWYAEASTIADYVATWGVLRFWALSKSTKSKGGENSLDGKKYAAWDVGRKVLCHIVGSELGIKEDDSTETFRAKFDNDKLDMNQQILLTDLLLEIADTVQFWAVRLKEVHDLEEAKNKEEEAKKKEEEEKNKEEAKKDSNTKKED
ncbi:hypothetical protein [Kamptonema formosum]|uniref:hypothetical protein n=1 Tax=Kamptonema formosum TaxID=331992 RepID=UPI000345E0E8|nr:hypothetical protein [Kamptonema formosum]